MFVQIIEGRAADATKIKQLLDRWNAELRPGADGFLGSTGGVTPDGRSIVVVRFASEAAARANSARPEQGEWWQEMEQCYDGPVSFVESADTGIFLEGGADHAGFVQVMKTTATSPDTVAKLDALYTDYAADHRPDLIGSFRVWTGPTSVYEVNYFTSEAEARAAEQAGPPPGLAEAGIDLEHLMANTDFLDISEPWLT